MFIYTELIIRVGYWNKETCANIHLQYYAMNLSPYSLYSIYVTNLPRTAPGSWGASNRTPPAGGSAPRTLDSFGFNRPSQQVIGHHWLALLNHVPKSPQFKIYLPQNLPYLKN